MEDCTCRNRLMRLSNDAEYRDRPEMANTCRGMDYELHSDTERGS
jgi:hypothetical protein